MILFFKTPEHCKIALLNKYSTEIFIQNLKKALDLQINVQVLVNKHSKQKTSRITSSLFYMNFKGKQLVCTSSSIAYLKIVFCMVLLLNVNPLKSV